MTSPSQPLEINLSTTPPLSASGGVTMLVGVEESPEGLRAYLGSRYKGVYLLVEDEAAQAEFRQAWGTVNGHIWLWPVPPAELLLCEAPQKTKPKKKRPQSKRGKNRR